jgi:hypothetical protein
MMGPYKGAKESRRGYTRASDAFARREEVVARGVANGLALFCWRVVLVYLGLFVVLPGALLVLPIVLYYLHEASTWRWWEFCTSLWLPYAGVGVYLLLKKALVGHV